MMQLSQIKSIYIRSNNGDSGMSMNGKWKKAVVCALAFGLVVGSAVASNFVPRTTTYFNAAGQVIGTVTYDCNAYVYSWGTQVGAVRTETRYYNTPCPGPGEDQDF